MTGKPSLLRDAIGDWFPMPRRRKYEDLGNGGVRHPPELAPDQRRDAKINARNVVLVSLGMACLVCPLFGLQALESSINDTGGIGSACLALSYTPALFSVTFLSPYLMRKINVRRTVQLSVLPYIGIISVHFKVITAPYLTMCAVFGLFSMINGTAITVLTTSSGIDYAALYGVDSGPVLAQFSSVLFLGVMSGYLLGPLASSAILHTPERSSFNMTAPYNPGGCGSAAEKIIVNEKSRLALMAVYLVLTVLGNLIMWGLRPPSGTSIKAKLATASIWSQVTATIRLVGDIRLLLLIPTFMSTGIAKFVLQIDITKFFVTPCLGVQSIGFMMACFATGNITMTLLLPSIMARVNKALLVVVVTSIQVSILMMFVLWHKFSAPALLYGVATLWGVADAGWNICTTVMVGSVFPDQQEAAMANFYAWQGLGLALGAFYSQRLGDCIQQLRIKFLYTAAYLILAMVTFICLSFLQSRDMATTKPVNGLGESVELTPRHKRVACNNDDYNNTAVV